MGKRVRIGLFLRQPPTEAEATEMAKKFPDREIDWVSLTPRSAEEAREQIKGNDLEAVLLPNETLVEKMVREGEVTFLLPVNGGLEQLVGSTHKTKEFLPR